MQLFELPRFLRVLVMTDGTVTKSLAAYFGENIEVQTLSQSMESLGAPLALLDKAAGDSILRRKVRLHGARTGVDYAYADTFLDVDRISLPLQQGLHCGVLGVGELLREKGMETYREVLEWGGCAAPSDVFATKLSTEEWVRRTYSIASGGHTLMQITEYFPIPVFRD